MYGGMKTCLIIGDTKHVCCVSKFVSWCPWSDAPQWFGQSCINMHLHTHCVAVAQRLLL